MTYAYFKSHPLRTPKNQMDVPISKMLAAEAHNTSGVQDIHPAAGAFVHYGGVELADKLAILQPHVSDEDMAQLMQLWNMSCGTTARHLLFYVWKIIFKEMRHGNVKQCEKAFGPVSQWTPAQHMVAKATQTSSYEGNLKAHPNLPIGPVVAAVEQQFRKGGWQSAYGGPNWANIALELLRYLKGEASAMVAADRCWTLVHNTGPIFNKGFYFTLHDSNLMKVLNAQAKSSVFTLGKHWAQDTYNNPIYDRFSLFTTLATNLIQQVDPDYEPGLHKVEVDMGGKFGKHSGGVNAPDGSTTKTVGPIEIFTTKDREPTDA